MAHTIKETLVVTKISEEQLMKTGNGKMYRKYHFVVCAGDNAGKQYHTFVSDSYRNKKHWEKVEKEYDRGLLPVIDGRFTVIKDKIDADSKHFSVASKIDTRDKQSAIFLGLLYEKMTGQKIKSKPLTQVGWGNFISEA